MKIIAEIGINHNGDVATAKRLIEMAARCGADAVKFQKRTIDKVYTKKFLSSLRESPWGTTQREQKEGLEFGPIDYGEIVRYCEAHNLEFGASAWDIDSLHFIESFKPKWHKVASAMRSNDPLVHAVASMSRLTYVSTAGATMAEVESTARIFEHYKCPYVMMHCVALYPCPDHMCNLNRIRVLQEVMVPFKHCKGVGYSGHEADVSPSAIAAAMGVVAIERHITLDRSMYGSDQAASLEEAGFRDMITRCRKAGATMGDGSCSHSMDEINNLKKMQYWRG